MSAEPLPAPLKIPEVSRFINRANQLRTIKPAIAYWCEYHAVNQIVSKSLHTSDDDCFAFTKALIERLEATKGERADDDAIIDNTAGQAYVEQFAQETFTRAERTLRANKVTRQTADTFDAAATFFDLTHEWGTPDAEVLKKIKFAKWNAARILKAIREGKDPNESNPVIQEEDELEQTLNADDPSVQQLISPGAGPAAASVEDVPDAGEPRGPPAQEDYFPPGSGTAPEPFVPSPLSQSPGPGSSGLAVPPAQVSPVRSPDVQVPPQPSPQIPTKLPSQYAPPPPEPSAPVPPPESQPAWSPPPAAAAAAAAAAPHIPPPSAGGGPSSFSSLPSHPAPTPPPVVPTSIPPPFNNSVPAATPPPPAQPYAAPAALNHKSIEQAQKHAKFAISALNFEDVSTAVQELRTALAMLGAQ